MPVLFRLHCISQFVKLPAPASDHCYDYCIFYAGGFVFISHKDKYSARYGLFALQVLDCRTISQLADQYLRGGFNNHLFDTGSISVFNNSHIALPVSKVGLARFGKAVMAT